MPGRPLRVGSPLVLSALAAFALQFLCLAFWGIPSPLFLSSAVQDRDSRWEFLLDFMQILIVSAAFYPLFAPLYMSGFAANAVVRQGVLDNGIFLITKPFTPSALTSKVREVLDHVPHPS